MATLWARFESRRVAESTDALSVEGHKVAGQWFASLRLGRQLGTEVLPILSRKEQSEAGLRAQALLASMVTNGQLYGSIRIPHAVAPIQIVADLK